jgi:hypothetical protein
MTIADLDGLVRIVKHKLEKGPAPGIQAGAVA